MTPPGGGRPATRGVFAIEEQGFLLPDPIALDTSFVVEALIATQPLHAVCSAFLTRIDDSGVSVATSDLLPFELAEAAFAIALKERWGGTWRRHRPDGRARRHAASAIAAKAEAIVTLDTGFALLPASLLTVYTDRSRLASCRQKRAS
jgi:hypothetical protein